MIFLDNKLNDIGCVHNNTDIASFLVSTIHFQMLPLQRLEYRFLTSAFKHSLGFAAIDEFWSILLEDSHVVCPQCPKQSNQTPRKMQTIMKRLSQEVPLVLIDFAFRNTETNEVIVRTGQTQISKKEFQRPKFVPVYEIVFIKVMQRTMNNYTYCAFLATALLPFLGF